MVLLLVSAACLHMGTMIVTILFGYFALRLFTFRRRKLLAVAVYVVAVAAIGYAIVYYSWRTYVALPEIADTSIPAMASFAERNGIELPFTDFESLRAVALSAAQEGISSAGRYVHAATFQFALLLAGLVAAASLFLSTSPDGGNERPTEQTDYYTTTTRNLAAQFKSFYRSFATVMGAQLVISIINASLTAVFLLCTGYRFVTVLIVVTLLCGLLPIIGNLLSNTLVIGVGFTVSPRTALFAFFFLIVIHKLEYFLNSKIIGHRIRSPMWLMLIALLVGEKLMGIPGMILAPVILHYIKVEVSASAVKGCAPKNRIAHWSGAHLTS
jgi:predicted PurR-regulated permease PerM